MQTESLLSASASISAEERKNKFTPFFDVNTYIEKDYEFNIHPSVGYRFKHFNVKVGYLMDGEGDGGLTFGIGFDFGGRKKK